MSARPAVREFLWWLPRAHWALSLLLLAAFSEVPRWSLLLTAGAWAAGAAMDRAGAERRTLSRLGTPLVGVFLAVAAADLLFLGGDLLASASLLLLGIQSIRFLLPKSARDGWQLHAIAFLEFLAAAASTEELAFALVAFLFLLSSVGAMWSLHDQEAAELGRPGGGFLPPARRAAWTLLWTGLAGFFAAGILFVVVPRLEFRRVLQRYSRAQAVSGFSDAISLREVTGIKADRRVAARVEFTALDPRISPENLYLRGAVYSRYANGGWVRRRTFASPVPRAGFVHVLGASTTSPLSTADITLEPADHPGLFAYGHPVTLEGSFGPVLADAEGNLFLPQAGHPTMRYRLQFAADLPRRPGGHIGPGKEYLEFPDGHEDVRALAEKILGSGGTDAERADRLMRFFRSGFRYTVADPATSLPQFLFKKRAGHCEHYAAALALLLRAGGIPSRVAAGYLGGEWNDFGQYLIVRQSDAHAWVEAWIDGRWVTLDATPPQGEASPFFRKTGMFGLSVDILRQRWDKYVVNYSLRMQAEAVTGGWSVVRRAGRSLGFGGGPGGAAALDAAKPVLLAALALFLSCAGLRGRRGRRGPENGETGRLPAPYRRLLRRLERSGFRPSPGASMEEMMAAAVRSCPELSECSARFLLLYHRDRFGPAPLSPGPRSEAYRLAERLRRGISGSGTA